MLISRRALRERMAQRLHTLAGLDIGTAYRHCRASVARVSPASQGPLVASSALCDVVEQAFRGYGFTPDTMRFSAIAHSHHVFFIPISFEKADRIIELLCLSSGAKVLDLACGKGEFLTRVAERYDIVGIGIDHSQSFIQEGQQNIRVRGMGERVSLELRDAKLHGYAKESFDLVMCMGASQLFGDPLATLRVLGDLTKPAGLVLFGTTYWKAPPSAEFLRLLDIDKNAQAELVDYYQTIQKAIDLGFTPLYVAESNQDEWDHYEWLYRWSIEQYLQEHPDDLEAQAFRERNQKGRQAFLEGGRVALGFGLFLYRKQAERF